MFSQNLKDKITALGGKFELNSDIQEVKIMNNVVSSVKTGKTVYESDIILWTAPLTTLCGLLDINTKLKYRDLIVFNYIVKKNDTKDAVNNYQWCYFGDKNITLNRTSKPMLFSKNNVTPGRDSVCVEVSCSKDDSFWNTTDILKDKITSELIKINVISSANDVIDVFAEKIENVYPIYTLDFDKDLAFVKDRLSQIKNLYLAGRSGLFWYNNMDDSIENGLDISKTINESN